MTPSSATSAGSSPATTGAGLKVQLAIFLESSEQEAEGIAILQGRSSWSRRCRCLLDKRQLVNVGVVDQVS